MPRLTIETADESGDAEAGSNLLEAVTDLGVAVESTCGGDLTCGRCKVVVEDGASSLPAVTDEERALLSDEELERGYRLACAATLGRADVRLSVPAESRRRTQLVLTRGEEIEYEKRPAVRRHNVVVSEEAAADTAGDFETVAGALRRQYGVCPEEIDALAHRTLPGDVRGASDRSDRSWRATVTAWNDREVIEVEPGFSDPCYGMAIDLGTTTVAGYLLDLRTGEEVAVESSLNPQIRFGEDLVTRLAHARDRERIDEVGAVSVDVVNEVIAACCERAGVPVDRVYEVVMVGNTAMHHLFLGIDPTYVARAPYSPGRQAGYDVKARELGLDVHESGYVHWLPLIAGWIGADTAGALLASRLSDDPRISLLIDIGTNGEVIAGNEDRILATSTPAGPALEGGEIRDGMRAAPGSVEAVSIDPPTLSVSVETIGDRDPVGICGSGIIDAVAELFEAGVVDRSGRIDADPDGDNPIVIEGDSSELECVLVPGEESGTGRPISITQTDLRQVQKAKAALQAGGRILLDELGVDRPDRVLLAGAFGNYIDEAASRTIGLYPDCPLDAVSGIGNAAGSGAKLALMDTEQRAAAAELVDRIEFIPLGGTERFREEYVKAMQIPNMDPSYYDHVS